jgi:dehydrogenase/reductase SDR family member 7B
MNKWIKYFNGKRVWVTGASSGIGRALVHALGEAGVSTVASARREDRLTELADSHESVHALRMDIADFTTIEEMATRAWDLLGGVDILINNAGVSQRFIFSEADEDVLRRIVDVNLTGTMLLTRATVSRMLAGGGGHLVAVTSLAARVPTPLRTVYTAAKMGLHGLFDSLRGEVEPKGIAVTLVVPGLVNTEISETAMTAAGEAYGVTDQNQAQGMSPDDCAQRILSGIAKRRREFAVAMVPKLRLATFLRRFLPGLFFKIIANAKVSGT